MTDSMPLNGYSHLEFFVGNAKQAAHFYRTAFGFTPIAYAGPETGVRDRASWVMEQDEIRFVLTAGLGPDSPIVEHTALHGDGVHDVAFAVPDAEEAFAIALRAGATAYREPEVRTDDHGKVVIASICAYGETIHSFVQRTDYSGVFLPGYVPLGAKRAGSGVDAGSKPSLTVQPGRPVGLKLVDHIVANVELGKMDEWARFYERVLGFTELIHYDDEAISTEYSALMSKVIWDGDGRIKMPINEPAAGKKRSQIDEYLDFYHGPGVQHVALATDDIVTTVAALRENGLRFMSVPSTYYDEQRAKLAGTDIDADIDELERQNILIDTDDEGYLLQIFTEQVQDRPTVFYEVIERHGSRGFGEGNFKALFEAIERDQDARGNL